MSSCDERAYRAPLLTERFTPVVSALSYFRRLFPIYIMVFLKAKGVLILNTTKHLEKAHEDLVLGAPTDADRIAVSLISIIRILCEVGMRLSRWVHFGDPV